MSNNTNNEPIPEKWFNGKIQVTKTLLVSVRTSSVAEAVKEAQQLFELAEKVDPNKIKITNVSFEINPDWS